MEGAESTVVTPGVPADEEAVVEGEGKAKVAAEGKVSDPILTVEDEDYEGDEFVEEGAHGDNDAEVEAGDDGGDGDGEEDQDEEGQEGDGEDVEEDEDDGGTQQAVTVIVRYMD